MIGAKLVLPGPKMGDPETLQMLIEQEQVTFTAGVPTVWEGWRLFSIRRASALTVSSACSLAVPPQPWR
jgi:acyl-CoA synthetase (AMP-forming)/AMP-acid ligase II